MNVNAVDYDGRTALHVAIAHGHTDIAKWLVEMKANVDLRDNFGLTAVAEAVRHNREGLMKVLKPDLDFEMNFLRQSSDSGQWNISADEVQLEQVLSTTLKSTIYTGLWRGTKIVAKTSGTMLARMSRSDTDSEDAILAAKEMLHEIKLISTMRHPDLVLFLGACLDHSPMYFLTEFMEGGDLERFYIKSRSRKDTHIGPHGKSS